MAARVLSTDQAKSAITQIQAIINGGLTEQISKLDSQGKVLSNPDVWDGPLAQQFRDSTWPETKSCMFESGACVQPYADGQAQAAFPNAT